VHWNPCDQFLVASASDDGTVRLWGLEEMPSAEIVLDSKDLKRIDQVGSQNGSARSGVPDSEDEEIDSDVEEERLESVQEDEEEEDEWDPNRPAFM